MARRAGVQAEVLASLALVMAAATGVLAVVLVAYHEAVLRPLLAGALAQEGRATAPIVSPIVPGTRWWLVPAAGEPRARDAGGGDLDAVGRALAREARAAQSTVIRPGVGREAIRVAVPLDAAGQVAVARLPEDASVRLRVVPRRMALGVLVADALVFTVFGATLLRRRLVLPLRRLRDGAEAVARGERGARVPVEGTGETADLASAFNTMTEALERRTEALEKAVADLRAANRDLRRARVGLDRAERLAAVGRLAAGVAHEVGNPLGAILAFLDLVRRDAGLSEAGRGHLVRAVGQGERVREILRQLLDFSRPARGIPGPVDLRAAAEDAAALVRAQQRYAGVEIEVAPAGAARAAFADPNAIAQILLNLLLNAADAVRGGPAPRVRVRVAEVALAVRAGEDAAAAHGRAVADAIECRVEDSGPGVPDEDRERIFDPFFTTKEQGQGTGLGLSNALRLAEQNGGTLELAGRSPLGGAAIALRLPAQPRERADQTVRGAGST